METFPGRIWRLSIVILLLTIVGFPDVASAMRCATPLRGKIEGRFEKNIPPLARSGYVEYGRSVAPVSTRNSSVYQTTHFRVIYGLDYDTGDPEWAIPAGGIHPLWVTTLGDSLEEALAIQTLEGFPLPYGVETYFIDVYIGNTGLEVYSSESDSWQELLISSSYFAYTEIDRDYKVAYFVFNDDYGAWADNELEVLKAVAAHELFHAVQRSTQYPWDAESSADGVDYISDARWAKEGWWIEATATWMEEVTFPDIDDYTRYVGYFMQYPHIALTRSNGRKEYGAAIFPGYLWLEYGGSATILDIFEEAYIEGYPTAPATIESSMRLALSARSPDTLEDVVSAFWANTNHPQYLWPDGLSFGEAHLTADVGTAEFALHPTTVELPGRFGANVYRFDNSLLPAQFHFLPLSVFENWREMRSCPSDGSVEDLAMTETATLLEPCPGDYTYVTLVNVSKSDGKGDYIVGLGIEDLVWVTDSSSGSGGCFLKTLTCE